MRQVNVFTRGRLRRLPERNNVMSRKSCLGSFVVGIIVASFSLWLFKKRRIDPIFSDLKASNQKMHSFYNLLIWWVKNYQDEFLVSDSIKKMGFRRVAIYGIKELGERAYVECVRAGIEVPFFIDKCGTEEVYIDGIVRVIKPSDISSYLDGIDAVIVTAVTYFEEIERELRNCVKCPIVSLEDVVYGA